MDLFNAPQQWFGRHDNGLGEHMGSDFIVIFNRVAKEKSMRLEGK